MVKYKPARLDATFFALSDATRRAMVERLARAPLPVGELAQPFAISLPAVSKHLTILEQAGLVAREKQGRTVQCRLLTKPMLNAAQWLDRYQRFWEQRLAALGEYLKEDTPCSTPKPDRPPASASAASTRRRRKKSSGRGPTRRS